MGKNSGIEWTHHTFNPWWGCVKVSPACKHCYAEAWAKRTGAELWGIRKSRRFFSDAHWKEPIRWNKEASEAGERRRVFCASMADVFEHRDDLDEWRSRLWQLIDDTPMLDWLLLTKRPEQIGRNVPWGSIWPQNVWLGTTAENQSWAAKRIPELVAHPATVRFLSCEPLLGPIDLSPWLQTNSGRNGIDWVIAGGESGGKARPMNPEWARQLRDQCSAARVAFHFKQWGNWRPLHSALQTESVVAGSRSFGRGREQLVRLAKRAAGRDLDGRTWDEVPVPDRDVREAARLRKRA